MDTCHIHIESVFLLISIVNWWNDSIIWQSLLIQFKNQYKWITICFYFYCYCSVVRRTGNNVIGICQPRWMECTATKIRSIYKQNSFICHHSSFGCASFLWNYWKMHPSDAKYAEISPKCAWLGWYWLQVRQLEHNIVEMTQMKLVKAAKLKGYWCMVFDVLFMFFLFTVSASAVTEKFM